MQNYNQQKQYHKNQTQQQQQQQQQQTLLVKPPQQPPQIADIKQVHVSNADQSYGICNTNMQPNETQYGNNYERAHKVLEAVNEYSDVNKNVDNNVLESPQNQLQVNDAQYLGISNINTRAVKEMFTEEYLLDLASFKRMNLMDSDNLDELFSFSTAMSSSPASISTLFLTMYRSKYSELFDKYQSIESYLLFIFMGITCNGFEKFKKIFGTIGPVINDFIPTKNHRMSKFALFRNQLITDGNDVSKNSNDVCETSVKNLKTDTKKPIHPMLRTNFYMQKKILFNIGEMYKYLVPADFAISEASCTKRTIKIYDPNNKRDENGVEMRFNIPVLCRINQRSVSAFTYNGVDNSENLLEFATKCFGYNTNHINISTKKNQPITTITDFMESFKTTDGAESTFAIASTFSFYVHNEKTVAGRCFSEKLITILKADRESHTTSHVVDEDPGAFDELAKYTELLNDYNTM